MSRRVIPGLEAPDPTLEREIRARLEEVEAALEKAVRADSDLLAETARYLLEAGANGSGRCSCSSPATSGTPPTRG